MFCPNCGNKRNNHDVFCSRCGAKYGNAAFVSVTESLQNKKWMRIIIWSTIGFLGFFLIFYLFVQNNYKLEMNYTEGSIRHFVKGIEKYSDDLDIEIEDIRIDDDNASANIYVKHSFYEPVELCLSFEYGHSGWSENGYLVRISAYSGFESRILSVIAEGIELMLTKKTVVRDNYEQHIGEWDDYEYELGTYYCRCSYDTMGGSDNFDYMITTHPLHVSASY